MLHKEEKTDLGSVLIHNEVIGAIASLAACEVAGVAKMSGSFAKGIYEFLSKKQPHKGVKIESVNDTELKITVLIVVEYGVHIPSVATQVQENVRKNVEKMTGLTLSEVDVNVQGVLTPGPKKDALDTQAHQEVKDEDPK
jgi:uncharacterized alkaline shock family protein YloU